MALLRGVRSLRGPSIRGPSLSCTRWRSRKESWILRRLWSGRWSRFRLIASWRSIKKDRPRKRGCLAQLLIRKLGSFIRLWRVILLRSYIRLTTSGIRYASFWRIKYHESRRLSYHCRLRQYHSDEVGISLLLSLPICVIMGLTRSLPCVKGGGSRRLTEGL